MELDTIINQYKTSFLAQYGSSLLPLKVKQRKLNCARSKVRIFYDLCFNMFYQKVLGV